MLKLRFWRSSVQAGWLLARNLTPFSANDVPLSDYAVARFSEIYNADAETVMLECMKKVLPGMQDSPFGKLLERFIPANPVE